MERYGKGPHLRQNWIFLCCYMIKRKGATWLAEVKQTYKPLLIDIEMLYAVMD